MLSKESQEVIVKWVDTQITFNLHNINQKDTLTFFKAWQNKYIPTHPHIELHSTIHPAEVRCCWKIYFCTSSERYRQLGKSLFEPSSNLESMWGDFVLFKKEHIIILNVTADSVNHIVVSVNE